MIRQLVLALILILGVPATALAQGSEAAPTELEIDIGLDGWFDRSQPVPISATVRSELLFAGTLVLENGRSVVEIEVEVPAGGEKSYEVLVSPTMADGPVTARLLAIGVEQPAVVTRVRPREATDSILVGTFDAALVQLPATTAVGEVPVIDVPVDDLSVGLDPLDYLVAGPSFTATAELVAWVSAGGQLVTTARGVDSLELGLEEPLADDVSRFRMGNGAVLVGDNLASEWTRLLAPTTRGLQSSEPWSQPDALLARAASSSVPNALTSSNILYWLALYAIVAGPVNMIVLRRLKRRELAWFTVPALGIFTLILLAAFGGLKPQSSQFASATLIWADPNGSQMHSVVVGASEAGTTHELRVGPGSIIYPGAAGDSVGGMTASADRRVVSAAELVFDFELAGYGTAVVLSPIPRLPKLSIDNSGELPELLIENDSPLTLTGYGVVSGQVVSVGNGELPAGSSATVSLRNDYFGTADQVVAEATQAWDDSRWFEVHRPLAAAAYQRAGEHYFFGFVEDFVVPVTIDGRLQEARGPAMVVVPLTAIDIGRADGRVIAVSPGGRVQGEHPWQWVEGEWAMLRFEVAGDRAIELVPSQNIAPGLAGIDAWDWGKSEYVEIAPGDLDRTRFVDDDGQVLLRIFQPGDEEFFGSQIYPNSYFLTWNRQA
ncbi:hypothetical protein BH18ACT6_BH18ACT6_03430 [soil metagenome]